VALDSDADVARWAGTRMAKDPAVAMLAVLVLLPATVLTARMRQHQRVVLRLFKAPAEALVLRQGVLSVGKVAVWTCPVVEGDSLLDGQLVIRVILLFLLLRVLSELDDSLLLLFLLLLSDVLLERLVEALDPALDTTQVERLTALLTVPESTPLIDWVLADQTLLGSCRESLNEEDALVRQVLILAKEVLEIVLDFDFVFRVRVLLANVGDLLLGLDDSFTLIAEEL